MGEEIMEIIQQTGCDVGIAFEYLSVCGDVDTSVECINEDGKGKQEDE